MAWAALLASAVFEAVWATALGQSEGFTQVPAIAIFIAALLLSIVGLAYAAKTIPMGTGYAVWTGLGAALTVAFAMITRAEESSSLKILFLVGIIGSVMGLKVVGTRQRPVAAVESAEETGKSVSTQD